MSVWRHILWELTAPPTTTTCICLPKKTLLGFFSISGTSMCNSRFRPLATYLHRKVRFVDFEKLVTCDTKSPMAGWRGSFAHTIQRSSRFYGATSCCLPTESYLRFVKFQIPYRFDEKGVPSSKPCFFSTRFQLVRQ